MTRLVNIDRDLLVIPSVAIHMDRTVNKGTALNPAVDLLPLLGCGKETGAFRRLIAQAAGVREEHLLSTELFLYPRVRAVQTGLNGEFIVSPRLDDLQCVFACMEGFLAAKAGESVPVLTVFNNEEVGSNTRQGADSTFLTDVLERIADGCGLSREEWRAAVANSFMVSADNAHAIHPAHPEYADQGEFPVLGGGVVIKYNANQRYTTDTVSAAVFQGICQRRTFPCSATATGRTCRRLHIGEYLHSALLRSHGGHRPAPACHAQRLRNGGGGGYRVPDSGYDRLFFRFVPL